MLCFLAFVLSILTAPLLQPRDARRPSSRCPSRHGLPFLIGGLALNIVPWAASGAAEMVVYPMPSPPKADAAAWVEKNRATIEAARAAFQQAMADGRASVVRPEYQRTLGDLAFAVRRQGDMRHPLSDFSDIFKALPSYSNIHLFVPSVAVESAEDQLEDLDMLERTTIYPVESEFLTGRWKSWADRFLTNSNIWMRDIVLVGERGADIHVYLPLAYNATSDIQHNDSDFIRNIASRTGRLKVVPFPYFVRGGNVLVGSVEGRLIAFVGKHEVDFNAVALPVLTNKSFGEGEIAEGFIQAIKALTGASKVVVLPNTPRVFHIDQALAFLGPGRAAVLKSVDGLDFATAERQMFEEIRQALADNGFSIADIPSSPGNLSRYESSVNAVLFQHAKTGRRTVILPRFSDAEVSWRGQSFPSQMDLVADIYRQEGYDVVSVKDVFHSRKGNLHCITLPLN